MAARRVLFVEISTGGVLGGSLTGILPTMDHLDRSRFVPSLALFEPKGIEADLVARGIPVHVLGDLPHPLAAVHPSRLGRAIVRTHDLFASVRPRARALATLYRRERPAVVYLANGLTSALPGVIAAARCGIPVICHEKGFRRVGPVERLMSRWVDTCICMTDDIVAHYRGRNLHPRCFRTILDGIDTQAYTPGGGAAVRREFGVAPDAPLVGIVGHIQHWKGQHIVVDAMALARREIPDLRCLVVGGVHRQGLAYAEQLRARIAEADLGDHVILTGARRDVTACMDAMDIVLHSSVTPEPFGRVILEAMALGRPVIAPREGGPQLMVEDGKTGLCVIPRDPAALAAAIVGLLRDSRRRDTMGRAGRARAATVFDIRQHVRAIENVLDDVLAFRTSTAE